MTPKRRLRTSAKRIYDIAVVALAGVLALTIIGLFVGLAFVAWAEDWSAEAWAAIAAWLTASIALAAGFVAIGQVDEARRLRLEQAQPYVVVFMEPSPATSWCMDLVVRNFGATAAHDVQLRIDPAPRREAGEGGDVWLPTTIPVLVPGQEWRTFWDSGQRMESDLPRRHEALVSFSDSQGRTLPPLRSILDWTAFEHRIAIDTYGIHHAAKALRQIEKTLTGWRESPKGLAVFVRDGDAKDARDRERLADRRAERDRAETDQDERDA